MNWCHHLLCSVELILYLELMSSSSVFSWTCVCVSYWCLPLLSFVELTFVCRTDVFIFGFQLNLPLRLELISWSSSFSWTCLCISNWHLHFLSSLELILYLELMSSSSVFTWTYLCIFNRCLPFLFSVKYIFASRIDVFVFFPQLNLPLCLDLTSPSSFSVELISVSRIDFFNLTYLYISNWFPHLLSSVELTSVSRIVSRTDTFIVFLQFNLPLCFGLTSPSSVFRWTDFVSLIDGCIIFRQLN